MDLSRSLSHVANAAFQMFQNGECGFSKNGTEKPSVLDGKKTSL